jgi:GMP reductase
MNIKKSLNYHDVYIKPKKCVVDSRKECDTSVQIGNHRFDMPIIPANMSSVIDEDTCKLLSKNNWFYIYHRFGVDNIKFIENMKEETHVSSISVGVNDKDFNDIKTMKELSVIPDYITVDIAHGWSPKCEKIVKTIKDTFGESVFLIAGNVATGDAVCELEKWGADATKCGIAGGKVCITKNKTGFHVPMIETIIDCSQAANKMIIADGGIVDHGDIPKALVAGADLVMAGSLFSGYEESAGVIVDIDGRQYKEYFGSASQFCKNKYEHVEGKKILVDYKGSMVHLLQELKQDLQSSISYAGGKDLTAFSSCDFVIVG